MTARASDHPKVLLERFLGGWKLVTAADEERMMHYPIGAIVECQMWQKRSLEHLRLYWAVLHQCVDNSEGKYGRAEDLHDMLKVALGYTRRVKLIVPSEHAQAAGVILKILLWVRGAIAKRVKPGPICAKIDEAITACDSLVNECQHIVLPGSIAMDKMDQAEFRVYFDRAIAQLERAGYPAQKYIDEGKKKLARIRAPASLPQREQRHGLPQGAAATEPA